MATDKPGVLKEIDCFISGSLRKQLMLLMYKNRLLHRSLELEHVKDGRIKSTFDLLELNVGNGKNPSLSSEDDPSDSFLLRSDIMRLPTMLLGYFVNDECHFVPFDSHALVMDTFKEPLKEKSRVPETPTTTPSQAPSVVVSARLQATDSGNLRGQIGGRRKPVDNDADLAFRTQQNMAPWCPVRYRRFIPSDAFECRIPLLYPYEDIEMSDAGSDPLRQDAYTSSILAPLAPAPAMMNSLGRSDQNQPATLEELVQVIMLKAHVIRFNKLLSCARERFIHPHQVTSEAVLQHVQRCAVLVRGWWVVKSELLYPPTTYSEHSAISSTLLIRARDYIMAVFHRGEHLTRKTISSMTKLPALEATEILKLLAHKMGTAVKGYVYHWEFNPPDQDFIRKYPDIVQQQHAAWEARIRQLCSQLKLERLVSDGTRRRRRCSGRQSSDSDSETELEVRSLVSGVHVSTSGSGGIGSGRRVPPSMKRRRQLSLSQTADTDSPTTSEPIRKRARTQSCSLTLVVSTPAPPVEPNQSASPRPQFLSPGLPPALRVASPLSVPSISTPIIKQRLSSPIPEPPAVAMDNNSAASDATEPPHSSLENVAIKQEPPSSPVSPGSQDTVPFATEVEQSANDLETGLEQQLQQQEEEKPRGHKPDPSIVTFVHDKIRSMPIVSLSELASMVQRTLCGNTDQPDAFVRRCCLAGDLPDGDLPPPGSEAERELFKPAILSALSEIKARRLQPVWPTGGTDIRPEEPLFTAMVAGSECGAISESVRALRDCLLDMCEKQPSFRMKDLQDRLAELSIEGLSRKTICSMLKNFCVYRHNRYFLRHTIDG